MGSIVGKDGTDGADGMVGTNGIDGTDGVGINNVEISDDGILTVKLTNGTTLTLGNIKGTDGIDGKDGVSVTSAIINDNGELVLTCYRSRSVQRPYPYAYGNTAKNECIWIHGISQREEQHNDTPKTRKPEVQVREQIVLVQRALCGHGGQKCKKNRGIHKESAT